MSGSETDKVLRQQHPMWDLLLAYGHARGELALSDLAGGRNKAVAATNKAWEELWQHISAAQGEITRYREALTLATDYVRKVEGTIPRDSTGANLCTPDLRKCEAALASFQQPAAKSQAEQMRDPVYVLSFIANAKRFDRFHFDDDTAFADWAQSLARHAISGPPSAALSPPSQQEIQR